MEPFGSRAALAIRLERAKLGAAMLAIGNPVLWFMGVAALAAVLFWLRGRFSAEARERRRRDRSHRPVVSRKQGPTVKLAVNADEPKGDRKG